MPFSVAKSGLSGLVDRVVRQHSPVVVERHHGKEAVLVIDREDLANALGKQHGFSTQVFIDGGEYAVGLDGFGLHGTGSTLDGALDDLLGVLREYASEYFQRLEFYRYTPNRAWHYLPLVRFRATAPDMQRALLLESSPEQVAAAS